MKAKRPSVWAAIKALEMRVKALESGAAADLARGALQAVIESVEARPHETMTDIRAKAWKPGATVTDLKISRSVRRKPTRECALCGERYDATGHGRGRRNVCPACS